MFDEILVLLCNSLSKNGSSSSCELFISDEVAWPSSGDNRPVAAVIFMDEVDDDLL